MSSRLDKTVLTRAKEFEIAIENFPSINPLSRRDTLASDFEVAGREILAFMDRISEEAARRVADVLNKAADVLDSQHQDGYQLYSESLRSSARIVLGSVNS